MRMGWPADCKAAHGIVLHSKGSSVTRVFSEAMIQSQRHSLAARSRPPASDRPSPFAELLNDPDGRQPAPDQDQIAPRPTIPLRNPTGPRQIRQDSGPSRPDYEVGKDCETRTSETSPPAVATTQSSPGATGDACKDAGTDSCTGIGADADKDQADKNLTPDPEAQIVAAVGDPALVLTDPTATTADTVIANDAVAGLAVPPGEVPAADAASASGSESGATPALAVDPQGKGAATGLLAQAGSEIAGSAVSADKTDADEAANGKPATAASASAAKPAAAQSEVEADGKTTGVPPAEGGGERSHAHVAPADAVEALSKKSGQASPKLKGEEDSDEPRAAGKPAADLAQVANLPAPVADRLGHLTPAAPAAHTGAAATAETSAAVPVAGLAVEIAARAQSGSNRFEIRLDPPELGRIDVRLDVDKSGNVTSHLVVEKSATLDLLRRDAPELERALQQAGLKTDDGGLQFSLRDQQFAGRDDNRPTPAARVVVPDAELAPIESVQSSYGRWSRLDGGIDIRV